MSKLINLTIGAVFLGTLGMYLTLEGNALMGGILSSAAAITIVVVFKLAVFRKTQ